MIDIDFFKKINDTYGHLCGDQTLRQLAKLLQQMVRTMDIVSRYGGEEFCCVLPETSAVNAFILAERLRSAVEASDIIYGDEKLRITISLGVAEYGPERTSREELVGAADAALYRAKHGGRNRVVCIDDKTTENSAHQEATL
jgi:diguanylate cyclase (GGDEF)-like protein